VWSAVAVLGFSFWGATGVATLSSGGGGTQLILTGVLGTCASLQIVIPSADGSKLAEPGRAGPGRIFSGQGWADVAGP